MKKKKSFTLLEVVIAIALTALCAPVLFSMPFQIAKKEINSIFLNEIERLADKEFYNLKIDLLNRGPFWKEMMKNDDFPRLLEKRNLEVSLTARQKRTYAMQKDLLNIKSKSTGKLFEVKISLQTDSIKKEKHSFIYFIAIPFDV